MQIVPKQVASLLYEDAVQYFVEGDQDRSAVTDREQVALTAEAS
jgi:hypothetical protein